MANRQGETRRSMWFIAQAERHSMSAIWPRLPGRPGRAIGVMPEACLQHDGPLNRMTRYAFRAPPGRMAPPRTMTARIPREKAGIVLRAGPVRYVCGISRGGARPCP